MGLHIGLQLYSYIRPFFLGCGQGSWVWMLLCAVCLLKCPYSLGFWLCRRDVTELHSCPENVNLMVSEPAE